MKTLILQKLDVELLLDCANGHDIRSSDREKDRAKQRLRRLHLIEYVGAPRRWTTTDLGEIVATEYEKDDAELAGSETSR